MTTVVHYRLPEVSDGWYELEVNGNPARSREQPRIAAECVEWHMDREDNKIQEFPVLVTLHLERGGEAVGKVVVTRGSSWVYYGWLAHPSRSG